MRNIKSYVLRGGRLSSGQKRALEELSYKFCIPYTDHAVRLLDYFPERKPLVMEIGFGKGEAAAAIAEKFPENNYIGIDVYPPGVGRLLQLIEEKGLQNLRIIQHDAVEVLQRMIPDNSLFGMHVFFPDPWPKKKHHKRRLINREFIDTAAAKLQEAAYLYAVTDWHDYADQISDLFSRRSDLFQPKKQHQYRWRPKTKFEQKGLDKNHEIQEFFFIRNSRNAD